jgi:hypothetical protein
MRYVLLRGRPFDFMQPLSQQVAISARKATASGGTSQRLYHRPYLHEQVDDE